MNSSEFMKFLDDAIYQEMMLGGAKNEYRLLGLRNIKSDFNYIMSKDIKVEPIEVIKKMYKERAENAELYQDQGRNDLWLQETTEKTILQKWLPKELSESEVIDFLNTLTDIPKTKASFKKFQDACLEHFGQKVESKFILDFIG